MGFENLSKNLVNELNNLNDLKKNIEKSYETSIQVLRWHYIYTENKMNQCVKDYAEIKKIMDLLMEALKGMKGGSIPSLPEILKEYGNIGDKKEQNKKIKAESLLKKYIVGEMDMEQIAQLSKKSSSKVSFNDKNIIKSNIFEDSSINSSGNKKGKFSRLNTRSFIKHDSNRFSFNRDSQSSDIKSNNVNLFSSQRLDFSKKSNDFGTKISSNINFRSNKNNNSALDDKIKTIRRMEITFFNDRKFLKLNDQKSSERYDILTKNFEKTLKTGRRRSSIIKRLSTSGIITPKYKLGLISVNSSASDVDEEEIKKKRFHMNDDNSWNCPFCGFVNESESENFCEECKKNKPEEGYEIVTEEELDKINGVKQYLSNQLTFNNSTINNSYMNTLDK
jgi:hypothetical protein